MSKEYLNKKDALIVRENSHWDVRVPGKIVVVDSDGNCVFLLPEPLSDDQVFQVLDVVNMAFNAGHIVGESAKAFQIRRALEI